MLSIVGMHVADPFVERGIVGLVRLPAAYRAPLSGVEALVARKIVIPNALAGGFERVVPAALALGEFQRIALALIHIEELHDHVGRKIVFGKGGRLDEGGKYPELIAARALQADFPRCLLGQFLACGEGQDGAVGWGDTGIEGRQFFNGRYTEGTQQSVIGVDDTPLCVERGKCETGTREKPAIKRNVIRFSHGLVGRTGWFGHKMRLFSTQGRKLGGFL